jgi:hypothetical protein
VDGVRFLGVGLSEALRIKSAGVFALARREPDGGRTLLYVGAAEEAGPAAWRAKAWNLALKLGADEFLFTLGVREPAQLEALKARVIESAKPPLNEMEFAAA